MKRTIFGIFPVAATAFIALSLTACDGIPLFSHSAPVAKVVVVNKKMILTEWPDSAYVASLEQILAEEPVKKEKATDANISMNTHAMPTFTLPTSVTGKPGKKQAVAKPESSKGIAKATPNAQAAKASHSAENFANTFSEALSKLQSDPSNAGLYKTVTASEGDDLFKLLKRTYGSGVQSLPRFYILSALQSVNAGVALEHLNAGDKVRVPKL